MNETPVTCLERELSRRLRTRRIVTGILHIVFLILGVMFTVMREATKEVVVIGEGIFSYDYVTYNDNYVIGIVPCLLIATAAGCILFTDVIFSRYRTIEVNGHSITVYRGMHRCLVYVDGEETDCIGPFSMTHVVDGRLPEGTKFSVSFSRGALLLAHISFSDDNLPIDL